MLTTKNYFAKLAEIDYKRLPADLKELYEYVKEVTENHTTWAFYKADLDIKEAVDQYLADLSDFLKKSASGKAKITEQQAREVAKKLIRSSVKNGETVSIINKSMIGSATDREGAQVKNNKIYVDTVAGEKVDFTFPLQSIYNEVSDEMKQPASKPAEHKKKTIPASSKRTAQPISTTNAQPVERVDEAVRFIKRFVLMHGKIKTDGQILTFINSLQKAILEKRIRKTSAYAEQIGYIQKSLITCYNNMGGTVEVKIQDKVLKEFLPIAGSEKIRLSVSYMKRYIGLQGKHIDKEKAKRLHGLISAAVNNQEISKTDPYRETIMRVLGSLKSFIDKAKPTDTLSIHSSVLNGIQETLDGCCAECDRKQKNGLNGTDGELDGLPQVMNSLDFVKLEFPTIAFTGKWRDFIGNPSPGFSVMVFGLPKFGKSTLCIDFAGYLAEQHGRVLYVAKEERLHRTLQDKIKAMQVSHPRLDVASMLPDDLSGYDYIFLDSVNLLGLSVEQLRQLKARYPGKSFVFVFQSTKAGKFRGENSFQHDVDSVVEVQEWGKARQYGRYNQGGEMDIFEGNEYGKAA
ncbi:hypothetical protein HGH93_12095 [Chitinophaga polysaccharea]|uniref:hypothetical protein n=1 Tax=Chitinophaga polysaccharea TaxID=1293035 RepID=UPI00145527DA|nr:hypothetical protein [Chitinophaga polysaccharea]NLR58848.1 hypothetical protein [Chitinophaga polysaccharea]